MSSQEKTNTKNGSSNSDKGMQLLDPEIKDEFVGVLSCLSNP